MTLRLHVDAAEAMHAKRVLDPLVVLGRGQQPDHVGAAEDQRLAVAPTLHTATLRPKRSSDNLEQPFEVDLLEDG